jgi:prolyl oligopeptidase PreP (S9A serine peptidase family)
MEGKGEEVEEEVILRLLAAAQMGFTSPLKSDEVWVASITFTTPRSKRQAPSPSFGSELNDHGYRFLKFQKVADFL